MKTITKKQTDSVSELSPYWKFIHKYGHRTENGLLVDKTKQIRGELDVLLRERAIKFAINMGVHHDMIHQQNHIEVDFDNWKPIDREHGDIIK